MDEKVFSLSYLSPIAKELARALGKKEAEGFLDKVNAYYLNDPRSLSGMCIGNIRLLINELLRLRKETEKLRKENSALRQIDYFLLLKEMGKGGDK